MIHICAILGLVIILTALVLAVVYRRKLAVSIRILGCCVFLAIFVLVYPCAVLDNKSYSVLYAFLQAMQAMLLNLNIFGAVESLDVYDVFYMGAYKTVVLVLQIIAPLFTIGITLSFFEEKLSGMYYFVKSAFHCSYIYSALTLRTVAAAEGVYRRDPQAVLLFVLNKQDIDDQSELVERVKKIYGVICFREVTEIKHNLKHKRNYFLLSGNSHLNTEQALEINKMYKGKKCNVEVTIYSNDQLTNLIYDNLEKNVSFKIVNESRIVTMNLLSNHSPKEGIRDGKLNIVIIGPGYVGITVFKQICWASVYNNCQTTINVVGLGAEKMRQRLLHDSSELLSHLNVQFHEVDVESKNFNQLLQSLDPTYIVVALGQESFNIETSLHIRKFCGLHNGFPQIYCLIGDKETSNLLKHNLNISDWRVVRNIDNVHFENQNDGNLTYEITPFGTYDETYGRLSEINSFGDYLKVVTNALQLRLDQPEKLVKKENLDKLVTLYEYVDFRQRNADFFALGFEQRLHAVGLKFSPANSDEELEKGYALLQRKIDENLELLLELEKRRFTLYMYAEGWTQLPVDQVDKFVIDKLTKRYARMGNYDVQALQAKFPDQDFRQKDIDDLYHMIPILRFTNQFVSDKMTVVEE